MEAKGRGPGFRWAAKFHVHITVVVVAIAWGLIYYMAEPGPEFLPVALLSLILGVLLGQVVGADLRNRMDTEIQGRDAEIKRITDDRNQLLDRLMNSRESSAVGKLGGSP